MPFDVVKFAEEFGWLVAIAFVLVLNGDKIAARLGTFIPPLADWLKKREAARREADEAERERIEAATHHALDADATWQAAMVSFQNRLLTVIEVDLARSADDGKETRAKLQSLADTIKDELRGLAEAVRDGQGQTVHTIEMFGKTMTLHTQTIAVLVDKIDGFDRRNGTRRKGD